VNLVLEFRSAVASEELMNLVQRANRTRPEEEGSFLTILKVESSPTLGVIVHARIDGVRIENPLAPSGVSDTIGHIPLLEAALDESVTTSLGSLFKLVREDDGYGEWRRAFDEGEAGVWSITVAEVIDHIADTMSS
jgi:hypothetical protein